MAASGDGGGNIWGTIGKFLWSNRDWILEKLGQLREWFRRGEGSETSPGILILGPGGTGKSTLARLLSEDYNPLLHLPGKYEESIGVESYTLKEAPGVEIVVPPGQKQRRDATWTDLHNDLAAGRFRGVILLTAYGYHSFGLGYKQHRLYQNDKERFLEDFCDEQRKEELAVLRQLAPHVISSSGKIWILTLVSKQDLWWPKRKDVEKHYLEGGYNAEVQQILTRRGSQHFRHEFVFGSLVISNFLSGADEPLKRNAEGFDQKLQVESLRRLFEVVDALRQWESPS